jgi:hypothetical protein
VKFSQNNFSSPIACVMMACIGYPKTLNIQFCDQSVAPHKIPTYLDPTMEVTRKPNLLTELSAWLISSNASDTVVGEVHR